MIRINIVQLPLSTFAIAFFAITLCNAQFYNKEIIAKINVEQNSEFYSFTATAENITPADSSLRYEFLTFKEDSNGNTSKSSQGNRFVISSNNKQILSSVEINYSQESKITLVLIIYDLDDKPIGKDRLVLEKGGKTKIEQITPKSVSTNQDLGNPEDGFTINGLVIENTITKVGRDFYKFFYTEYYNKKLESPKNIVIVEVPGRFRNTRISVNVGGQLVWQFFSQPSRKFLQQMATTALQRTIAQIQRLYQQNNAINRY